MTDHKLQTTETIWSKSLSKYSATQASADKVNKASQQFRCHYTRNILDTK